MVDKWMRDVPGAKTIVQITEAAIAGSWVPDPATAEQQIKTTIPRHRDLFVRTPDGSYLRRADFEAGPTGAGKIVRRRGSEAVPVT
jgi:hypothetical protein